VNNRRIPPKFPISELCRGLDPFDVPAWLEIANATRLYPVTLEDDMELFPEDYADPAVFPIPSNDLCYCTEHMHFARVISYGSAQEVDGTYFSWWILDCGVFDADIPTALTESPEAFA